MWYSEEGPGRAHDAPPDPLVGWGGGYPLPIPHPLDAFGVSVVDPPAVLIPPPMLGVWIKHWVITVNFKVGSWLITNLYLVVNQP